MAELKAAGILSEQVELTSASNTSITWSSKTTVSWNGSSSQGWASFPLRRQGERVPRYEVTNMIRKGDIKDQVRFIASLFGVAA
jgi:hypothetical protein